MSTIGVHFAYVLVCVCVCECECYHCRPAERSLHDLPPLTCISMPLAHFHYSRCVSLLSHFTYPNSWPLELPQGGNLGRSLYLSLSIHTLLVLLLSPLPYSPWYSDVVC